MLTMGGDIQVGVEQPIGTFFDGTNTYIRYRKVIDCGALPNNTTKNIDLDLNCIGVIDFKGCSINTSGNIICLPWNTSASNMCYIQYIKTEQKLKITSNNSFSSYTTTLVTIEYYR